MDRHYIRSDLPWHPLGSAIGRGPLGRRGEILGFRGIETTGMGGMGPTDRWEALYGE